MMKQNWEYKNIEECLEKVAVASKLQTKDFLSEGEFPIVSQEADYISGYWNNESDVVRLLHPVVVFGDHSRAVKYIDFDFVVGADGVKILSPKDFLNPKFLYYFVKSADIPSLGYSRHYKLLREKDVPVPPLSEQSRIVAELDLLTGIIDKQNAQLKELDNLAQAIFYDMFGDLSCDECTLIDLCVSKDDIKCGPFGTQLFKSEYQKEGVAVWGIPQINSHFIIPPSDYVSQEKAVALKDYSVVAGDIVMSRKGNVGQCSVFPDSFENGIIHSDVLRLRLDYDKANSIFMMYQLHLSDSIKHQIQLVSSGAIMPGINVTKLKNIKVQVPPLALQQSFAEKIQSIEKQKETIRASIADTQKLLDYTMDKYFG
ncbi:hypothetical protein B7990_05145 [Fibrobacter sp. UWB4]|uniref:restriction endonuclease subunit S n=1 Tax=Fibrobacter sp. UWB4 TaxID=1964356 RepID=UPI000B523E59|nr:restriction endonuclease subunit S [Fibrobacter sp. UWB4]OWV18662.1 hypothetical protein B7990_05145 [Fibrobacter sp. UWB4]